MKSRIAAVAAVAAMAFTAGAGSAQASGAHRCEIGRGGWVTAGYYTSCPFAASIAQQWVIGRCYRFDGCHGHVLSPVTDKTYMVSCSAYGHFPEHWECEALGTPAFIDFTYRFA